MKAKSNRPDSPAATSASRVSSAGRSCRLMRSATPAAAQCRRAMAVHSADTSQAVTLPPAGSASATTSAE